jgi:hydroxyacylglutathione hydrolase
MADAVVIAEDERFRVEKLELGPFGTNAYIVVCRASGESVLVDAPADSGAILARLEKTNPRYILLTHGHMDHTGALEELHAALAVPLAAHPADSGALPVKPDLALLDGDTVECGRLKLAVLHTPGHTPGSLCFRAGRIILSGDTIFPGGPGKTWSPADLEQIIGSITSKIFTLPYDTLLYPGHGGPATVGREKALYEVFASRPRDPGLCGDVTWQ